MGELSPKQALSYRYIVQKAWPIILANASVPLLGLVDTAVIGRTGTIFELGAIALGAIVFSFVYWGFGFLRMGTTGFVSQADGAGDEQEVRAALFRALLVALSAGVVILAMQTPIASAALWLLEAGDQVEFSTQSYISLRIWGAPAALGLFALMGVLVGLNMSKTLLLVQLVLNGSNIILDVYLAGVLDWGVRGIALGTAFAEWASFLFALVLVLQILNRRRLAHAEDSQESLVNWSVVFDAAKMRHMFAVSSDIMIRTLLLVFGFAWFANSGAKLGDVSLAANHILLQFVSFSAFFLDGFAYVAESLVGRAKGAKDKDRFLSAVRLTTMLAAFSAVILAAIILILGPFFIAYLSSQTDVQEAALTVLPMAALYVVLSFAAFQLDGIFIGTTRTRAMRNASAYSLLVFLAGSLLLGQDYGNFGLWVSFIIYVCARALFLLLYYRGLLAEAFD